MTVRQQNRLRRNDRIRQAFRQRYSDAPRPRKFSREYVLAQLANEFCLSVATIEDILYAKPDVLPEAPKELEEPVAPETPTFPQTPRSLAA